MDFNAFRENPILENQASSRRAKYRNNNAAYGALHTFLRADIRAKLMLSHSGADKISAGICCPGQHKANYNIENSNGVMHRSADIPELADQPQGIADNQ